MVCGTVAGLGAGFRSSENVLSHVATGAKHQGSTLQCAQVHSGSEKLSDATTAAEYGVTPASSRHAIGILTAGSLHILHIISYLSTYPVKRHEMERCKLRKGVKWKKVSCEKI